MAPKRDRTSKTIFVGNLNYETKHSELRNFFERYRYGDVRKVYLHRGRYSKISKRCAFVTFAFEYQAKKVICLPKIQKFFKDRFLNIAPATKKRIGVYERPKTTSSKEGDLSPPRIDTDKLSDAAQDQQMDNGELAAVEIVGRSEDIMPVILSYLGTDDLINAEKVCRFWARLALKVWSSKKSLKFGPTGCLRTLSQRDFTKVLKRCGPNLVELDASYISRPLDMTAVDLIGKHCQKLKTLKLYKSKLTNAALEMLAQDLPELETIWLKSCDRFTENGFHDLFVMCKKLEKIVITNNGKMSGRCFFMLGPNVRELSIQGCKNITREGFMQITSVFTELEKLSIGSNQYLSLEDFGSFYSGCQKIKSLAVTDMSHFFKGHHGLLNLSNMSNLVELNLSFNSCLLDEHVKMISPCCPHLQFLDISHCKMVTDYGISHLVHCTQLMWINVNCLDCVTGRSLVSISKVCPLENVFCKGWVKAQNKTFAALIKSCPLLKRLDLTDCKLIKDSLVNTALKTVKTYRGVHGPLLKIIMPGTKVSRINVCNRFWHRFLEIETRYT